MNYDEVKEIKLAVEHFKLLSERLDTLEKVVTMYMITVVTMYMIFCYKLCYKFY